MLRTGAVAAVAIGVLALGAAPGEADTKTTRDRGGASARGLTAKERRALDIQSVTARGTPAGVTVTARFKGNLAHAIGRRHLRRALVAMVLVPKGSGKRPAVLATRGAPKVADTLRRTATRDVAVIRDDRQIEFLVVGPGLENVKRIEVRAFARAPKRRARGADDLILDQAAIDAILDAPAADSARVAAPAPDGELCAVLREEAVRYQRTYEQRDYEFELALHTAGADDEMELHRQALIQIGRAQRALRPVLGANRCFTVAIQELGYQHFQGYSIVCADLVFDLPVAERFGRERHRLLAQGGAEQPFLDYLTETPGSVLGVSWRILTGGVYTVVFDDPDLPDPPLERPIDVLPPPSPSTRDCSSRVPPGRR